MSDAPVWRDNPDMNLIAFRSRDAFSAHYPRGETRRTVEAQLVAECQRRGSLKLIGYCQACNAARQFLLDLEFSNGKTPNFRERLVCDTCRLNNRQRFAFGLMRRLLADREQPKQLYLYEQVTRFFEHAQSTLDDVTVRGSEYLGPDKVGGEIYDRGVRHEDALQLTFADNSFDLIISNDVFEHVPDVVGALAESRRVLKPGGTLFFSVPFFAGDDTTIQRAQIKDGEVIHLLPPLTHGNPVDPDGSLVFFDFGWDLLTWCIEAGFKDAYLLGYYSMLHGNIGDGLQVVFLAHR